jgi:CMP/dCMP kinase
MNDVVIAIDGPAGAGKSTVSKILARKLGISYLDTGAMYRCLAFKALEHGLTVEEGEDAASLLDTLVITFGIGEPQPVFLNGEDVTEAIRTPQIGEAASTLSQFSPVRKKMVARQQQIVAQGGVVLEGRDVTTVVAPDATLKVYLTASLEERARRRLSEFSEKGLGGSFQDVRNDIEKRDHRDINRDDSPLKVAEDAIVVESAGATPEEVADKIIDLIGHSRNI